MNTKLKRTTRRIAASIATATALGLAQTAQAAAQIYWKGGNGSETDPVNIYAKSSWSTDSTYSGSGNDIGKFPCNEHNLHFGFAAETEDTTAWLKCDGNTVGTAIANLLMTHSGHFIFTSGSFTTANVYVGYSSGDNSTVTKKGGDWTIGGALSIGHVATSTGTLEIDGGLISVTDINVGNYGTGVLTINGGTLVVDSASNKRIGLGIASGSHGTLNLNGGVVETRRIAKGSGSATININGGTIKANAADDKGFIGSGVTVNVGAAGGTIDNAGYNITIAASNIGGSGNLAFIGGGTATLTGNASYSGKTLVDAGTLLAVSNSTAKANILSRGLEVTGVPALNTPYTVFVCEDNLTEDDLANVTCGIADNPTVAIGEDGKSIVVTATALKPDYWTGLAGDNNLSTPENWSDNAVPTSGSATILCTVPTTLSVGETFKPDTVVVPDASAFVTIGAGDLHFAALTNAYKLAISLAAGTTLSISQTSSGTVTFDSLATSAGSTIVVSNLVTGTSAIVLTGRLTLPSEGSVTLKIGGTSQLADGIYTVISSPVATATDAVPSEALDHIVLDASEVVSGDCSLFANGGALFLLVGTASPYFLWTGCGEDNMMSNPDNWYGKSVPGADDVLDFTIASGEVDADVDAEFSSVLIGSYMVTFNGKLTANSFTDTSKMSIGENATVRLKGGLEFSGNKSVWLVNAIAEGGRFVVDGDIVLTDGFTGDNFYQCVTNAGGAVVAKGLVNNCSDEKDGWSFRLQPSGKGTARWIIGDHGISGAKYYYVNRDDDGIRNAVIQPLGSDFEISTIIGVRKIKWGARESLEFDTTGDDGEAHTITIGDGTSEGGAIYRDGTIRIVGNGKVVANYDAVEVVAREATGVYDPFLTRFYVTNTASFVVKAGANLGLGNVTMSKGTTLGLPGTTNAVLHGKLLVTDGDGETVNVMLGSSANDEFTGRFTVLTAEKGFGDGVTGESFSLANSVSEEATLRIVGNDLWVTIGDDYTLFLEGDKYGENDSCELTQFQAEWLNGLDDYSDLKAQLATVGADDLGKASLLNLDIFQPGIDGGIAITNIVSEVVGDEEVITLDVVLTRVGALSQAIGGTLKLYGTTTLESLDSFADLGDAATIEDAKFSSGDMVKCRFSRTNDAKMFFRAKIVESAD